MRGINKVTLIGRLGKDPEVRYTAGGAAVANITLATSETWKDKQTGEKQERTEWHRVVFFSRLAEIVGEYLKKGALIYVEGRIQTRKWQDQSGQDRYTTEIVGGEMQMLGSKGDTHSGAFDQSAPAATPSMPLSSTSPTATDGSRVSPSDDFDDDIPF